jgi:catechol 2,3-dioxygenase-like lactoylglutathione lyase family enzyme
MRTHLTVPNHGPMDPASGRYMIRINGHLGATLPAAFPAMAWQRQGSETVLTGVLDQPGLYAVLAEIEALGLDLLEVRQLATRDPDGTLFEFVEPRLPPGVGRQAS